MDFFLLAQQVLDLIAQRRISQQMAANPHWRSALAHQFVLPTREQLAHVLAEAFYATLLADEGRPTRFALSVLSDEVVQEAASGQIDLDPPQQVTRSSIRRLAPTAPPRNSILRIRLEGGQLRIVSVLSFAENWGRPVGLAVAGHRPGVLSVSFNNQKVLHLNGGEVTALDGTSDHLDADFGATLLAQHQEDGSYQGRLLLAVLVWQAVVKAKRAGHGGAFWFMPSRRLEGASMEMQRVAGTGGLFRPIMATLERVAGGSEEFRGPRELAAETTLRWAEDDCISSTLSHLAGTDGAVLLSTEPRLLGFSAFVHHPPPSTVRRRWNGRTETVPAHSLGGGRHRSAVAFCAGGEPGERAAMIVSQDGVATIVFSVGKEAGHLGVLGAEPLGVFAARIEEVGRGFAGDE